MVQGADLFGGPKKVNEDFQVWVFFDHLTMSLNNTVYGRKIRCFNCYLVVIVCFKK